MNVERLMGPRTHICWTPDGVAKSQQEVVSLVRESDLIAMEIKLDRAMGLLERVLSSEDDYIPIEDIEDFLDD